MELTKEDKMLLAGAEDKFRQCCQQYCLTYTNFLDLRQRSLVEKSLRELGVSSSEARCVFYGGYEDAERTMAVFLPDYADERDCPLSVIRIKAPSGGRKLTHRDYLGSLLGLGLKREMTGDILVTDSGADIIVMEEVKDFILFNYDIIFLFCMINYTFLYIIFINISVQIFYECSIHLVQLMYLFIV